VHGHRRAAPGNELVSSPFRVFFDQVRDDNTMPLLGERPGITRANTPAATCHDRHRAHLLPISSRSLRYHTANETRHYHADPFALSRCSRYVGGGRDDRRCRQNRQAAERLGYECLTCSEHVVIPAKLEEGDTSPGSCYWDPLATFGYLAAHTSRIRLATIVIPLPYHHPLDIAKRYGTLDRICGGRVILGVGVGYLKPEFAALGVPLRGPQRAERRRHPGRPGVLRAVPALVRGSLLPLRWDDRRPVRRPGPSASVGGRTDAAFVAAGGQARANGDVACGSERYRSLARA
jgi:Luciferase-like monooxygenase